MSINQINANIRNLERHIVDSVKRAVQDCALDLQGKSQQRAPLDTGDLRGSASTDVSDNGDRIVGIVAYSEPYALRQHEELEYNHPRGGEAKYLENPFKENETRYRNKIANAVRDEVR